MILSVGGREREIGSLHAMVMKLDGGHAAWEVERGKLVRCGAQSMTVRRSDAMEGWGFGRRSRETCFSSRREWSTEHGSGRRCQRRSGRRSCFSALHHKEGRNMEMKGYVCFVCGVLPCLLVLIYGFFRVKIKQMWASSGCSSPIGLLEPNRASSILKEVLSG